MQKAIEDAFVEQLTTVNRHYKEIIEFLAHIQSSQNRTSNGTLTKISKRLYEDSLKNMSYNLNAESHLARSASQINICNFITSLSNLSMRTLGFAFETFCHRGHFIIAKILGFHGVRYQSGALYKPCSKRAWVSV